MTEREALTRAICEAPDEDTPRLVFADWLDEHGEPDRAEFIRVQVRFADLLRRGDPDTQGLARRARELWSGHGKEWLSQLPRVQGLTWHDAFFRGFTERAVAATDSVLVRNADAVFGQPLRQLVIKRFTGAVGFPQLRGLRHLKALSVANDDAGPEVVAELLRCDDFAESLLLECSFRGPGGTNYYDELRAKFGKRLYKPNSPPPSQAARRRGWW